MARNASAAKGAATPRADWLDDDTWLVPLPVPEVREGGDSTWALWHEAERQLDEAFAPTLPSDQAPLGAAPRGAEPSGPPAGYQGADELMVVARRNNRVCPNPAEWSRLYQLLEGDKYIDLQPPPVEQWIWGKLSHLQKRVRFREHIDWAARHGKLAVVAGFLHSLGEADWLHMG
ncbi:MAG TPA: hypothetical protein VGD76_02055 [Ramlibacter sp.]